MAEQRNEQHAHDDERGGDETAQLTPTGEESPLTGIGGATGLGADSKIAEPAPSGEEADPPAED